MRKYCVIAAVGKDSLHRDWIVGSPCFDLHLIVYDEAYEKFKNDAPYVTKEKGFKFNLIDKYLSSAGVLRQYEYFYFPDDDILIDSNNIHKLFRYMEAYRLMLAQPAIWNYYITHPHTMRRPASKLRYTNFVEIMQPCFSREALQRVQFTFSASKSGWGIDFHWPKLLDPGKRNMAIIDDIVSFHSRPVRSHHDAELAEYLKKYDCGDLSIYSIPGF
ncbi:MAG: hypothetical protein J0H74_12800 [Chitinophagaceae bacterium]|nr:hypothetical protein [Chitinophagaceae bacterium]